MGKTHNCSEEKPTTEKPPLTASHSQNSSVVLPPESTQRIKTENFAGGARSEPFILSLLPGDSLVTGEVGVKGNPSVSCGISSSSDPITSSAHSKEARQIEAVILAFKAPAPISFDLLYANTTQRAAIKRLITKVGFSELLATVSILDQINATNFITKTTTPLELERNWDKIKHQVANQQSIAKSKFKLDPAQVSKSKQIYATEQLFAKQKLAQLTN